MKVTNFSNEISIWVENQWSMAKHSQNTFLLPVIVEEKVRNKINILDRIKTPVKALSVFV